MSQEKIFSLENLVDLTGGDSDFISEMIHMYISHAEVFVDEIRNAIDEGDIELMKSKAHKFKTSAQLFQIINLHDLLAKLEKFRDIDNKNELNDLLLKIENLTSVAVKQLKTELGNYD